MTAAEDSQRAVIEFLSDPANFDGMAVKRIDTHAASVFLVGDRAHKIKRAVRFSFLDFSTLAKRKAACEAEIAVNRSFAPAIYRGVVGHHTRDRMAGLPSAAKASRSNGRSRCAASTKARLSTIWPTPGQIDDCSRRCARPGRRRGAHRLAAEQSTGTSPALSEIIAQNETELAAEPDLFSLEQVRALGAATPCCARSREAVAAGTRTRRTGAPVPWRSAPGQYCSHRRRAGRFRRTSNSTTASPPATSSTISPFS